MNTETAAVSAATPEAAVRAHIEGWLGAVRAGNLDRVMAHYAPDLLAFDAVGALQFRGVGAYRKHWEACMAQCPGPGIFEMHDLEVAVDGDLAFAHWLIRCGAETEAGEQTSWMRATACLQRHRGQWRIVHEHWSVPFDMHSHRALLDLQP